MMRLSRSQLRPAHVFWGLILFMMIMSMLFQLTKITLFLILNGVSLITLGLWLVLICTGSHRVHYMRLWASITGLTLVKVMDFDHKVTHTLVHAQPDNSYTGHLFFHWRIGVIRLLPNGHVDPDCEVSYCYIWQPVDEDLKTQLQLTHWESWPSWTDWCAMSHKEMIVYRLAHVHDK